MNRLQRIFYGTEDMWLQRFEEYQAGNITLSNTAYENFSTIFTCGRILSDALSTIPINVFVDKDGYPEKAYNDYRHFLLNRRPNGLMNSQTWRSSMVVKSVINGNAFSFINRNEDQTIKSLVITDSISTKDYTIKNDELYYHILDKEGNLVKKISSYNVLHLKTISKNGIFGLSPAQALNTQLNITRAGFGTLDNHYRKGARPAMLLKNMVPITEKEAKNAEAKIKEFEKKNKGLNEQGGITMVPNNTEPIPWNVSIEDAKILDTIKFNKSDIAALYGIPVFMLGDYDQSKFNSIEYLTKFFTSFTARPQSHIWRKELEDKMLTDKEWTQGMSIEFNTNALIEMDTATKTDAYQKYLLNGVMEPGYVAELEGFPVPKTKDKYFVSNNHMEFETKIKQKELENEKLRLEIERLKGSQPQ